MNYNQVQIVVQNNQHLIGTINERGFEVSEIIIVPSDASLREQFIRLYMVNRSAEKSIQPFVNYDVEVWSIDTKHLFRANVLFYNITDNWFGMNLYRYFIKPLKLADVFTPNTTAKFTYIERCSIEESIL